MLRRLDAVDGAVGECPTVLWGSPRRRASRRRHRRGADRDSIHLSRTGHDHERKLIKKVKDLNGEIVNNASKVHTALKLSQDDQQTITTLRSEVEKAWKMVDTAQSKETAAKETITSLKEEIANLSGLVEKSAALTGTQEGMVQELTAARDELQRQTDEATGTCKVLETQLTNMTEVLETERLECATLRGDKADLEQSLAARSAEVQRGQRSKERLDKELKNTLKLLEARTGETCVEINQCVGCGRAGSVERRGTGIATPSSRRRVDGVEEDARTRRKILISTQAAHPRR